MWSKPIETLFIQHDEQINRPQILIWISWKAKIKIGIVLYTIKQNKQYGNIHLYGNMIEMTGLGDRSNSYASNK